jgi:hypothetical protein
LNENNKLLSKINIINKENENYNKELEEINNLLKINIDENNYLKNKFKTQVNTESINENTNKLLNEITKLNIEKTELLVKLKEENKEKLIYLKKYLDKE